MSWSGIILIIVGAVLLANSFGLLEWSWLGQWWPVALIGVGAGSVAAAFARRHTAFPSGRTQAVSRP